MGRLIGLELNNFKSYKGKNSIGFGTSYFTSIIGPNGAGKSNMMDAISFVLGIRSNHLRSSQLKDLIYRGRIMAKSVGEDVISDDEHEDPQYEKDPTKAYVMAIYEKNDGETIQLKRTITLNGNSEYKIDDRIVTFSEYSSILKRENILIKARNFLVFQGDVEAIASQSSKDLTLLLENISGSVDFKKEYDELKDQKDKAHESSNSIFSRKRTLNGESKQYKEQLVEIEMFEKKLTEKQNIIKLINLYKIYHNEAKHIQLVSDLKNSKKGLSSLKKNLNSDAAALKSMSSEYAKNSLRLDKKLKSIAMNKADLEDKKRQLIPITNKNSTSLKKLNNYSSRIMEISTDIENQKGYVENIENQLRTVKKALAIFEKNSSTSTSRLSSEGLKEYEQLRDIFLSGDGSNLEEQWNLLGLEKDNVNSSVDSINTKKQIANDKILELKSILDNNRIKFDGLTNKLNEANEQLSSEKQKLSNLRSEKQKISLRELELNSKLRDVLLNLDELNSTHRESERERKLRETVSTLKRLVPGVYGLVHDLVRPKQKKYELATSVILGKNFDSIIVDSNTTAYKCIEILKEQRNGVASFIPLDSVESKAPAQFLRNVHNGARLLLDVVDYDLELERAIQYVFSNSMVVDTMTIAKYVKWEAKIDVKVVTLEGSLIHKSGLMTGGKSKTQTRTWDKNEVSNLNNMKDELKAQLDALKRIKVDDENLLLEEIRVLEKETPSLRNNKNEVERVIKDKNVEIKHQKQLIGHHDSELDINMKIIGDLTKKMDRKYSEINKVKDSIYKDFCVKYKFKSIVDYETTHGSVLRAKSKEKAQFLKQISVLENKLVFERNRFEETSRRLQNLSKEKSEVSLELTELLKQKEQIENQIDMIESEIELSETEYSSMLQESSKVSKLHKTLDLQTEEWNKQISISSKEISALEETLESIDLERVNMVKNCKIENVNLPLKDGFLDQLPLLENSESLIRSIYELEVDYSMLSNEFKNEYREAVAVGFVEKLSSVQNELDSLTPNSKAVERLKEVEVKLKEFDKEFMKARQDENKIIEKFDDVKHKRYSAFMNAYDHIAVKIDTIYKELTKTTATPLGGSAFLTLEDEDEPYLSGVKYHAMPPTKRFRDMEFLSGGEKTIAALGLLFAIHSFQPSPFFVLDEVDAALDNTNVNQIANYIKNYKGPDFQFIVISLKNTLFEKSDSLVGIYREQKGNSSRTLTLDLRNYPEEEVEA